MNNLQLYITKTYDGFQNMLEINQEDAIKQQVFDLSDAVSNISYDTERINIFYLLRYTSQGVFVVILRTIPPRELDHLAAWIFVPSTISVPESDLDNVVRAVVDIITNSRITSEQFGELRRLFAKEYEPILSPATTVGNMGTQYAYRYYGAQTGYQLSDFLGSKKYQTSNLPFAGVILAEKSEAPQISGTNLTNEPLEQMVKLFPPKLQSNLYTPIIFGEPFTKPFLVPLMGTVEILWKSDKAVDVHQSIMISKPNMRPEPIAASILPAVKTPVTSQNHTVEPDADKTVPLELPQAESVKTIAPAPQAETPADETPRATVPEAEIQQTNTTTEETPKPAMVPEEKKDEPKPQTKNDEPKTEPVKAETEKEAHQEVRKPIFDRQHHYNFEIPAKSADISGVIKFEVNTRSELDGSPIDGYELSGPIQEGVSRSNHLIYTPLGGWQNKALYALIGFVVGVLLALLCTCSFSSKTDDKDTEDTIEIPADTIAKTATDKASEDATKAADTADAPADVSLEAAIRYLDSNKQWDKTTMESYPDLKGLYNDMNTFNKKRLVEHWGQKLKDSRQFANVAKHAKLGMKKTPRVAKAGQKTFNTDAVSTIKIQTYLNTIDP